MATLRLLKFTRRLAIVAAVAALAIFLASPDHTDAGSSPASPTSAGSPATGEDLVQGDFNCDGEIDEDDALALILSEAELPVEIEPGCPELGEDLGNVVFGDVNCSGAADLEDALDAFLFLAGLEFDVNRPCADIGSGLVTDGPSPP